MSDYWLGVLTRQMSPYVGVTHRPGDGGLLGNRAACGADPTANPGGVLRMHDTEFDCLVCMEVEDPSPPAGPCEGAQFATEGDAIAAGFTAGFTRFRVYACPEGHQHIDDAHFDTEGDA